jgi:hypothetical protein
MQPRAALGQKLRPARLPKAKRGRCARSRRRSECRLCQGQGVVQQLRRRGTASWRSPIWFASCHLAAIASIATRWTKVRRSLSSASPAVFAPRVLPLCRRSVRKSKPSATIRIGLRALRGVGAVPAADDAC